MHNVFQITPYQQSQKGVALLMVASIFAVVALIMHALLFKQWIETRRTQTLTQQSQLYAYALGGETFAKMLLARMVTLTPDLTHPYQDWAKQSQQFPLPHGTITINIEDGQGKFNLNNLMGGTLAPASYFDDFLQRQPILHPTQIREAIKIVAGQAQPNRFHDVSILREVPSLSEEDYQTIAPQLVALPEYNVPFNVNTATPEWLAIIVPDPVLRTRLEDAKHKQGFISKTQGGF